MSVVIARIVKKNVHVFLGYLRVVDAIKKEWFWIKYIKQERRSLIKKLISLTLFRASEH